MTALLIGTLAGAIHAVAGPDHVASLAPLCATGRRAALRIGLGWGAGHAMGTTAGVLVARTVLDWMQLDLAATWGDRLSIAVLGVMALIGVARWRDWRTWMRSSQAAHSHASVGFGVLHGTLGSAGILLIVPASTMAAGGLGPWLVGFAAGSTVAMAVLTELVTRAVRTWRERRGDFGDALPV